MPAEGSATTRVCVPRPPSLCVSRRWARAGSRDHFVVTERAARHMRRAGRRIATRGAPPGIELLSRWITAWSSGPSSGASRATNPRRAQYGAFHGTSRNVVRVRPGRFAAAASASRRSIKAAPRPRPACSGATLTCSTWAQPSTSSLRRYATGRSRASTATHACPAATNDSSAATDSGSSAATSGMPIAANPRPARRSISRTASRSSRRALRI